MCMLLAHYFGAQEALNIANTMNPSEIMARRENVTKRIEQFAAESKASGQVERYFHVISSQNCHIGLVLCCQVDAGLRQSHC